ncbi:MAG: glycosyltransferase [Bacteroidetes bacterium]|nr:glycosyltransferase [Bacteroidota bacterium]
MTTIVFHINLLLAGGIEKVLIDLLRALDPKRYRVKLSLGYNLEELEILRDKIPPHVEICYIVSDKRLSFAKKRKIAGNISAPVKLYGDIVLPYFQKRVWNKRLPEIIKDADVIVDFDTTLAPYYKLLEGKKKIAYSHFSLAHYWKENANVSRRNKLARRLTHYDTIITICDEMKEEMVAMYPELKEKVVRLYNALDFEKIKTMSAEPIKGFDDALKKDFFLWVGRLNETQKDATTLIKAYAACVRKHNISEILVLVGDGPSRKDLEELAIMEGMRHRIFFTGFDTNPYKWMAKARLLLFSSKFEGLPTVLIEALSLQKPIVATACPTGVKEILMHGRAGMLTQPGNVEEFSEAIFKLRNNEELQKHYIDQSGLILNEFDIRSVISNFETFLCC